MDARSNFGRQSNEISLGCRNNSKIASQHQRHFIPLRSCKGAGSFEGTQRPHPLLILRIVTRSLSDYSRLGSLTRSESCTSLGRRILQLLRLENTRSAAISREIAESGDKGKVVTLTTNLQSNKVPRDRMSKGR